MEFNQHFNSELERLELTRKKVCQALDMTIPTLRSRVNNCGTFQVDEIKKLQSMGFDLNRLI